MQLIPYELVAFIFLSGEYPFVTASLCMQYRKEAGYFPEKEG